MANAIAPGREQSWKDRVREGAYTGPESGIRITYAYEDVSCEFDKRTAAFGFGRVNGQYVQQNGFGSRRYPLRCYFTGPNHDRIAKSFDSLLVEHGIGRLEHALYGAINVVPFGTITRRDDLKTAANQTVIELEFWTTLETLYPFAQAHPQTGILTAVDGFLLQAAERFADVTDLKGAVEQANLKESVRKLLQDVSDTMSGISSGVTAVRNVVADIQSTINFGLDVFIGQPLQLAQQISNLITAPARALAGIESRLDAYDALASKIFDSEAGKPAAPLTQGSALQVRRSKIANNFHLADLAAMSAVAASVVAVVADPVGEPDNEQATLRKRLRKLGKVGAQFTTKPQAMLAAARIQQKFDNLVTWRDAGLEALETIEGVNNFQVDTGEHYQALLDAVALTTGFLVETSFSLAPEKRIVLDRARTIIDLSGELYRDVDNDTLDLLISTNNLTGDELLELPAGKSIAYYA